MAGRPKGSKDSPVVDINPSKCPICGSIRRSEYAGTTTEEIVGMTPDGTEYNRVVWRRCKCLDCDQSRADRAFEMVL